MNYNDVEEDHIKISFDEKGTCLFCNINPGVLEEEGLVFCNECLLQQKQSIFSYYMEKKDLTPDYSQITDKIFLGNEDTARSNEILQQNNISHILICADYCEKFFPDIYEYKILNLDDAIDQEIISSFPTACEFIDSSINNIYIHCVAGISRSPAIVIGYLMYKNKSSFEEAYNIVKAKRKRICPNQGFINQLKEFEKGLEK